VHAGAIHGRDAAGVDIVWKGPITESDREAQINLVQDFIAQGVGNIASGLLQGQPVGGSVGQTALNITAGAKGRWASVLPGAGVVPNLAVSPRPPREGPRARAAGFVFWPVCNGEVLARPWVSLPLRG